MGLFLFCMIFCGAISRVVNGSCCVHVRHKTRAFIVSIFTIVSFIMIAIACMNEDIPFFFWVAVGASVFQGISQSFGEAMFLGFLKGFPSKTVGYISCGTGFAGIFATATLLICKAIPISNQAMCFMVCPTVFLYYYCFSWLVNQTKKYEYIPEG